MGLPVLNINGTVDTDGDVIVAPPAAGRRYTVYLVAESAGMRIGGPGCTSAVGVKIPQDELVVIRMPADQPLHGAALATTVTYSAAAIPS